MEPVKETLSPVNRLALEVLGWGALVALSFFFHLVAFVVVLLCLANKAAMFKFVYENTRIPDDPDLTEYPVRIIRHERFHPAGISGATVGSFGEIDLRENLSEGED